MAEPNLYKLLRISPSATSQEIKIAYYKVAMKVHPDRQNGCEIQFRRVQHAYETLRDVSKRRAYDKSIGRMGTVRKDYRKVYTSRPPPDWKFVWDHQKHQDMHYGEGMMKEAIKSMRKEAKESGELEYKSPLGKGFVFGTDDKTYNPYARRTPQGPPKVVYEYTEGTNMSGKEQIHRKTRIVEDFHQNAQERRQTRPTVAAPKTYQVYAEFRRQHPAETDDGCAVM